MAAEEEYDLTSSDSRKVLVLPLILLDVRFCLDLKLCSGGLDILCLALVLRMFGRRSLNTFVTSLGACLVFMMPFQVAASDCGGFRTEGQPRRWCGYRRVRVYLGCGGVEIDCGGVEIDCGLIVVADSEYDILRSHRTARYQEVMGRPCG